MLEYLSIRNFAIVEALEVEFDAGLNVLTGETGAGKSILVHALGLVLGRRAESDAVRAGASSAIVEARFGLSRRPDVRTRIEEMGIPCDETLLVARSISAEGRGRLHLNGRLATVGMLASVFEGYFAIYGQNEGPDLLRPESHLELLDEFGGHGELRREMRALVDRRRELEAARHDLAIGGESLEQRLDFLDFQGREIDEAKIVPGEEARLLSDSRRAKSAEKLFSAAAGGHAALYADDGAVVERLDRLVREITSASEADPDLARLLEPIETSRVALEEAARELRDYADRIDSSPGRFAEIDDRLARISVLKRKYGGSEEAILEHRKAIEAEREGLANSEERAAEIERGMAKLRDRIDRTAAALHRQRKSAARKLGSAVTRGLESLGFRGARFEVSVERRMRSAEASAAAGPSGADRVEFLFAPHPGEPPRPLRKIASGGELSRALLAIRRVLLGVGRPMGLVFDEVDTGIGGRIAEAVGAALKRLSAEHQVLCITHLPQIAALADTQLAVTKVTVDGRPAVAACRLSGEERAHEIARMAAGAKITKRTLAHARDLLGSSRP